MTGTLDLPLIWALLIAFAVLAYVVLDGFDLGIGILFPCLADDEERTYAMATIAPVWDGNETWLVLGGGGLFAAFPLAYSLLMPAFYAPLIAMLLGLILRGVAFEFRLSTQRGRTAWDIAFSGGSAVAAFAQGIMAGALVQGIHVENRAYAGGWFDWLSPFTLMTGAAVLVGYALLGATWLIWKTEGEIEARARGMALPLSLAMLASLLVVSVWTPFLEPRYFDRWLSWPAIAYTAPVPLLTAIAGVSLVVSIRDGCMRAPFLAALALFVLAFVGLGVSLFPLIVPPSITIHDAAAPDASLGFLIVGAVVLVPMILAYTAFAYWIFRGKTTPGSGYHH